MIFFSFFVVGSFLHIVSLYSVYGRKTLKISTTYYNNCCRSFFGHCNKCSVSWQQVLAWVNNNINIKSCNSGIFFDVSDGSFMFPHHGCSTVYSQSNTFVPRQMFIFHELAMPGENKFNCSLLSDWQAKKDNARQFFPSFFPRNYNTLRWGSFLLSLTSLNCRENGVCNNFAISWCLIYSVIIVDRSFIVSLDRGICTTLSTACSSQFSILPTIFR